MSQSFREYVDNLHTAIFGDSSDIAQTLCYPAHYDPITQVHALLLPTAAAPVGFTPCSDPEECAGKGHGDAPEGVRCFQHQMGLGIVAPTATTHSRTPPSWSGPVQLSATHASPKQRPDDPDKVYSLAKGSAGGIGVLLEGTLIVGVEPDSWFGEAFVPPQVYILMVNEKIVCREEEIHEEIESCGEMFTIKVRHRTTSTLDKFKLPPTKTSEVQGKGRKRGPAAARKGAKTILDTKITGAPRKMRIQQFEQIQRRDERAEAKARSEAAKANTASRKRSASAASAPVKKARTKKSINVAEASDSDSSSSSSSEVAAKKVPADRRKNIQDIAGAVVGQLVDNMPGEMRVAAVQSMIKAKSVDDFTPDQFFCFANTYYPRPGKRDQKLAMKKLMPALKHERSNAFIDLIDYVVSPEKYGQATKLSTDDLKDCIAMRVKHVKTLTSEKFEALPKEVQARLLASCNSNGTFLATCQKLLPVLFTGDLLVLVERLRK